MGEPSIDAGSAAWLSATAAVLRKSGRLAADATDDAAWLRLARTTVSGMTIPPLGTAAAASDLPSGAASALPAGRAPFLRGAKAAPGWDVRSLIDTRDGDGPALAAASAEELGGGATSLWIVTGPGAGAQTTAADSVTPVLASVHTPVPVVLQSDPQHDHGSAAAAVAADLAAAASGAAALTSFSERLGERPHPESSLGADPIWFAIRAAMPEARHGAQIGGAQPSGGSEHSGAGSADVVRQAALRVAGLAAELGIGAIVIDGAALHDCGADDATEVGYTLACGVEYLRMLTDAGLDVDAAARALSFRYAITGQQFLAMAKLRAARLAWHRICQEAGVVEPLRAQRQHAVTSRAMMTRYDRHTNMLRTTIAAFAAAAGGADAVTVLPFDLLTRRGPAAAATGPDGSFGMRMARNTSALLAGEAFVDAVADPAGGSYAIEQLTTSLAEAAWAEFVRIEGHGGVLAAAASGLLWQPTIEARVERDRRIATRRQPITGVSEFPDSAETRPAPAAAAGTAHGPAPAAWADPFESLRDHPAPHPILLLGIGTAAAASPRVQYIRNLLAAGGIRVEHRLVDANQPAAGIAAAMAESGCRAVMVAGADTDYAEQLAGAASAARAAGATTVHLAGRPKALLAQLPDGLVDATVAAGDDVLAYLRELRGHLGATR